MTSGLPRDVLVVCGLMVEARIAAGAGVRTIAGGGRSDTLAVAIEQAIADGVAAIISFGVAGALVPGLRPGALMIATSVVAKSTIAGGDTWSVDEAWSGRIAGRLGAPRCAIAGSDRIVATPADKAALQRATGALVVDMESHVAARAACVHRLPFAALRVVTDPLDRSLPPAATIAMRDGGGIDLPAVLRSIARSPGQLPDLIAIARDTRRALKALGQGRRLLGRRFGYADLDQLLVDVV